MSLGRRSGVLIALAVIALVAVVLTQLGGRTPDPPANALSAPGVFESPPFRVRVSGPLWQARSVKDQDGVDDFAVVADDLPLDVQVRATGRARIASVELRLDGRRQQVTAPHCEQGACPAGLTATLRPRVRGLAAGRHRVEVRVRRAGGRSATRTARFQVRTASNVPAVVQGEPARKDGRGPPARDTRLARDALAVLAAEQVRPGVAAVLPRTGLNVIQVGPLNARERPIGATLWVALPSPMLDVRATVPAYVPSTARTGPAYTPQVVRMHVAVLRDALIDVDLTTRRVIAVEPGPRSRTLSWKPSQAPAPAGAGDED